MITSWPGQCSVCKTPIPAKTDVSYDPKAKTITCWECMDNPQPPTSKEIQMADQLGYLRIDLDDPATGLVERMERKA